MVQRSSILLRGAALFFCGVSCAPETLKIHVPPTGVHSLNQEDLRRAYWALESGDDPEQWWLKRTKQFHLESSPSSCHVHPGEGEHRAVVYAAPTPMQLTVMASLAKALDGTTPTWSWYFCLVSDSLSTQEMSVDTVINLKDGYSDSPPFVDVNFEHLARDVEKILREQMLND